MSRRLWRPKLRTFELKLASTVQSHARLSDLGIRKSMHTFTNSRRGRTNGGCLVTVTVPELHEGSKRLSVGRRRRRLSQFEGQKACANMHRARHVSPRRQRLNEYEPAPPVVAKTSPDINLHCIAASFPVQHASNASDHPKTTTRSPFQWENRQ
jgi:hypothetical protein